MKLNIGCGKQYREGWVNVDINPSLRLDVCHDVDEPWPWPDSSVDEIYCYHVLEHCKKYLFVVDEMWRVCKPNAILRIGVPYVSSSLYNAVNPYHINHFNEHSFRFFDSNDLKGSANENTKAEFRTESVSYTYFEGWADKPEIEKEYARRHYWNVVRKIDFVLRAIK